MRQLITFFCNNSSTLTTVKREWKVSIYKYKKTMIKSFKYKADMIEKIFNLFFFRFFHSKAIFKIYNNKILIILYLYEQKSSKKFDLKDKKGGDNKFLHHLTDKMIKWIEKVLPNHVIIVKIIKLRYPYLNAEILAKYLALKCKKTNFSRLQIKLSRKMKKARFNYSMVVKKRNENLTDNEFNKIILDRKNNEMNYLQEKLRYKHLTGIKLQLKGRMNRRRTAQRTRKWVNYKGSLKNMKASQYRESIPSIRNQIKPNINYGKYSTKNRNGAYTVKVWLSGE